MNGFDWINNYPVTSGYKICPEDCPDVVTCGCGCSAPICLEHSNYFDFCDQYGHITPECHAEVCPDSCLDGRGSGY